MILLLLGVAAAQTPADPWRTVRTDHFEVHYPAAAEGFALDAVGRLEAWHARVVEEVGYAPDRRIRAMVVDPFSEANGSAFPFARQPRMLLYATPPEASSVIGHYRSWAEDLLVHEDAHLAHLMRPARNGLEGAVRTVTGLGPVILKSPRWVYEGYATVVEARLTGFGRPNGDLRALVLRRLAQEGQLPTYGQLDASERWMGGSFAYLVGSAYLEWLEARAGAGSLRALWARLSARELRSFEDAFRGVFGEAPEVLYGRFAAELTAEAVAMGRAFEPSTGTEFERIGWWVGPPAVSPDGTRVAVSTWPKTGPAKLVIYATATDPEALEKRAERIEEMLAADPDDVAPVAPPHEPHERVVERASWAQAPRDPRWLRDGSGLLFAAGASDLDGRRRYDLYRFTLEPRRTERLTRGADLRSPDPAPDGTWAAAVRTSWGTTELVRVDLATGAWTSLQPPDPTVVVDCPRVSPDGTRLAWLENRGEGFGVVVRALEGGPSWRTSPGVAGAEGMHLAWSADGRSLHATTGHLGFVEVHEVWHDGGVGRGRLTSTPGGALWADVAPDGVFYLTLTPRGYDLHRATLAPEGLGDPAAGLAPARRPDAPSPPGLPASEPLAPTRYGLGRVDVAPVLGGAMATAGEVAHGEAGLRLGDPVGRWEIAALGALAADRGPTGVRLSATWRGLPLTLTLDGWRVADTALASSRTGAMTAAARELRGPGWRVALDAAGVVELPSVGDGVGGRAVGVGGVEAGWTEPSRGLVGIAASGDAVLGGTGGDGWGAWLAGARIRVGPEVPVDVAGSVGRSSGAAATDVFVLGGSPSSVVPLRATPLRVFDGAFATGIDAGSVRQTIEVAVGGPTGLYGIRHRLGDGDLDPGAYSAVGLRASLPFDAQPFLEVMEGRAEAGVACRVEFPGQGLDARPCQSPDDYAAWLSLRWGR